MTLLGIHHKNRRKQFKNHFRFHTFYDLNLMSNHVQSNPNVLFNCLLGLMMEWVAGIAINTKWVFPQ